jgi:hypothetical protein
MQRILGAWQHNDGVLLQDEAGLGKTNQALGAMLARGGKRNLIVVPTAGKEGLMAQWAGPMAAGLFDLNLQRVETTNSTEPGWWIVSYDELLTASKDADGKPGAPILRPGIFDGRWDTVAFDESHTMVTPKGQRTIAGKALQARADKVIYMSATPFTNVADMHYLTKLGLWQHLIGQRPAKEDFPAVPKSGVIGTEEEAFAYWAHRAGAQVNRAAYAGVKNPSSPLPMAALAAVLHVDGLSIKRMTSLEGVTSKFGVSARDKLTPEQAKAFVTATELCRMAAEGGINPMLVKALYVSWARQYWETLKVPAAIRLGKKALAEGKQVALYTSFKLADHRHLKAFPEMLRRRADRLAEKESPGAQAAANGMLALAIDMDKVISDLPKSESAVANLVDAFGGPGKVAEIHGNTNKNPQREQESYQGGQKHVVVATMAKGGTGISLHDTTGERPRVQINLSLPWSGREFNQVAGRSHRLGSKTNTIMHWLVGEDANEKHNAAKVAARLRSMGALTTGDPESTVSVKDLADFEFGNLSPDSDDAQDMVNAVEEMQAAIDQGADIANPSDSAQQARDWFREYGERRKAGHDVMGERFADAQLKRRAAEFRDARYAAEQLRQHKGWQIKWRPALKVFEVERSKLGAAEADLKSAKVGGKLQTYGTKGGVSFWVPPSGMAPLAERQGVHREKVDLRSASVEHLDPTLHSAFDQLHDILSRDMQLRVERTGLGDVKITGNTYRWFRAGKWYGLAQGHGGQYAGEYYYTMPESRLPALVEHLGGTLPPAIKETVAKLQAVVTRPEPTIREAVAEKQAAGLQELGMVQVQGVSAAQTSFANTVRDKAIAQLRAMKEPEAGEALRTIVQMGSARTILDNMYLLGWRQPIDPSAVLLRLGVGKSMALVVKAGGPYIGPRGGKWSDPQHTISWVDPRQVQLPHHESKDAPPAEPAFSGPTPEEVEAYNKPNPAWKRDRATAEAEGEMSRAKMRASGWRAVAKAGDLHRHGYQIVVWINAGVIHSRGNIPKARTGGELADKLLDRGQGEGTVMFEYLPRPTALSTPRHIDTSKLKRMTARNADEQREVHRVIGAGMPDAGEQISMFKAENPEVMDAHLERMRPRLVLREAAPGPWNLLWMTEEWTDELGVRANLQFPGRGADELGKGAGHKYLKRLPTGKPKRRWRYIYALPDGGSVATDEIAIGSKFAITHQGKTGHFEVKAVNHNGTVTIRHDESGRTLHVRPADLGKWFAGHHARRTAEVTARAERAKNAPTLERGTLADLVGGYQVTGFGPDPRELEVQAAHQPGMDHIVIPQIGGFVLASRPRHAQIPGVAVGESTKVFVRNDAGTGIRELDAEFVVLEADKVIPSHNALTFDQNPQYPEGVQERRYHQIPSEQLKIERIANGLEPRLVANDNPDAINGTPVVNSDGVVLGGNGRTMGIQRAYHQYPERAAALKAFLVQHAHKFGMSPTHIAGMKRPILVRRIRAGDDKAVLTKLGRRMNEPLMQGLDPRSEEVAVSRFVTQDVVDSLTHHMEADQSLSDFLSRGASLPFVRDVERAGIIDQYNRAKYIDEKTGLLNDDGRTRVTRVMAARMIPDADLLDAMPATWRESLARATPSLLQAEAAGWDLRPALTAAAKTDRAMQKQGYGRGAKDRKAYFAQLGLFGTHTHTPLEQSVLAVLQDYGDKVRAFPLGFKQVALEASRQAFDYGTQTALFQRAPLTVEEAVGAAFGQRQAERQGEEAASRVVAYAMGVPGTQVAFAKSLDSLSKAGQRDVLHTYLSQAVVWELQNLMRAATWAAGGDGHIDGAQVVRRLQAFIADQARRDSTFARALGAHPLTPAVLRALVQAQGQASMARIAKALSTHTMEKSMRGPFIGPKGGKWADAKHTISWHEPEAIHPLLQHKAPEPFAVGDASPSDEHAFRYASAAKPPAIPGTEQREVEGQWITYSKAPLKLDTVMEHKLAPLWNARGHMVLEHAKRLGTPVELKATWGTPDNQRAAALWQNPRVGWQLSHFDSHGASGHSESKDPVKLVNEAIQDGYTLFEPGVVDKIVDPVKVAAMAKELAARDATMARIHAEDAAKKAPQEAKRAANQRLFYTDWADKPVAVEKGEVPIGTIHDWAAGRFQKVGPRQWVPVQEAGQPSAIAAGPAQQPAQAKLVVRRRPKAAPGTQPAVSGTQPPAGEQTAGVGEQKPATGEQKPATGEPTKQVLGRMKGMQPSKVGVGAFDVPPPPPIPRLSGLPPEQNEAQEEFATDFEAHPDEMAAEYLAQVRASKKANVFNTDNAKMLSSRYNQEGEGSLSARGMFNLAVHQVANAIAKKAFLSALDDLAKLPPGDPKRTLLVTSGGVASGKSYALDNVAETKALVRESGAVWDAAGEQNATENPWVLAEAEKRGLQALFVFVDADPADTWENPDRGVMQRAIVEGRMVDAHPYADSYAEGARNFKAFYEATKNNPNARFVLLENRGTPRLLDSFPEAALVDRGAVYQRASQAIDSRAADLPDYVYQGGTIGRKVWGEK